MTREELYRLERLRKDAIIAGDTQEEQRILEELSLKSENVPHLRFPESHLINFVNSWNLADDIIELVAQANHLDAVADIDLSADSCRMFVEEELGVALSCTSIARLPGDYSRHEAYCVACGERDHLVVFPEKGELFESADLLIHELGHAAEHTLRRQEEDDRLLVSHRFLSETVAHYVQYKYLIEHGSESERICAVGSVTFEYLTLKAINAAILNSKRILIAEELVDSPELSVFVNVYGRQKVLDILSTLNGKDIGSVYYYSVEPRCGAILAMRLLNNQDIVRKIAVSAPDKPVSIILNELGLDADSLLDFSTSDVSIRSFIEGRCG